MPPPDWLVTNVITVGSQVVLFGPSGSGKSFVALDLALSIATGQSWHGLAVKPGPVAYVVAEGGHSIGKRVDAWIQHQGFAPIDDMFFVLEPVQLPIPDHVKGLLHQINARNKRPALIVFDTLARCFVGGEENSAKDVGVVVHHAGILQQATGAAVLILHHTGRAAQDQERGSTALRGAADVMIAQTKTPDDIITLRNTKQKDAEEFTPISLQLSQVRLDMKPKANTGPVTSCVVLPADQPVNRGDGVLNAGPRRLLAVLVGLNGDDPTGREWQTAVTEAGPEVSDRTFQRWRQALVRENLVEQIRGVNPPRYRLTEEGHAFASGVPA